MASAITALAADGATLPIPIVQGPGTSVAGRLPVGFSVAVNLTRLHPAATKGALDCGVVVQTREWVDAHRDGLTDYESAYRGVLGPAHYLNHEAVLAFPIADGSYAGTVMFNITLSPASLTDPSTHAPIAPNPTLLLACWLSINGRPALTDQAPGLQVVSSENFASVGQMPLVVAVADAGPGTAVSVTGQLTAQGRYFAPGPVSIASTVQISGPAKESVAGNCSVAAAPGAGALTAATTGNGSWAAHASNLCAAILVPDSASHIPSLPSGPVQLLSSEYGAPTTTARSASGAVRAGQTGTLILRVAKAVDAATPFFLQAWAEHLTIATLSVQFQEPQSGSPTPMRTYVLTNVLVNQIRHYTLPDPGGGVSEYEEMLLAFGKLQLADRAGTTCCVLQ